MSSKRYPAAVLAYQSSWFLELTDRGVEVNEGTQAVYEFRPVKPSRATAYGYLGLSATAFRRALKGTRGECVWVPHSKLDSWMARVGFKYL